MFYVEVKDVEVEDYEGEKNTRRGVELCSQKNFFSFDQNCSQVQSLK